MEYVTIKGLNRGASRIGLGTWSIGGFMWGGTDETAAIATILEALERGITLLDTAPAYGFGRAEELVGRALQQYGKRQEVIIATKVGLEWHGEQMFRNSSRTRIMQEIDDSLRRLKTDYIDIYQAAPLHTVQPPYNLFERNVEKDVLPYCHSQGINTLTYGSLCRGLLSGKMTPNSQFHGDDVRKLDPKFQQPRYAQYLKAVERLDRFARKSFGKHVLELAMRWALDQPFVTVALWGARHPEQLAPVSAIDGWKLDAATLKAIDEIVHNSVTDPVGPEFMAPSVRHRAVDQSSAA